MCESKVGFVFSLSFHLCIISTISGHVFPMDEKYTYDDTGNASLDSDKAWNLETKPPDNSFSTRRTVRLMKRSVPPVLRCSNRTSCFARCSKERQFHEIPEFRSKPACYCDRECSTVFSDCCADYEEKCSVRQGLIKQKGNQWRCFKIKNFPYKIWMIGKCKAKWPMNGVSRKCTNFLKEFRKPSGLTPVFDKNKNTYRNRYCAQCNGVKNVTRWKTRIRCRVPKKLSELEKVKYRDKHCKTKTISFKSETRGIRYCYNIRSKCKDKSNKKTVRKCKRGATAVVILNKKTYKNFDCVLCNEKNATKASCGPNVKKRYDSDKVTSFSSVFTIPIHTRSPRCAVDYIYDKIVGNCRKLSLHNQLTLDKYLKRIAIRLEYEQTENQTCLKDNTSVNTGVLASQVRQQFSILFKEKLFANTRDDDDWQLSDLSIHVQENFSCLVNFQILGTRKGNLTSTTNSSFPLEYSKLIDVVFITFKHDGKYTFCRYSLFQTITHEMSCVENDTYVLSENELKSANGSIFVNTTQEQYSYGEYVVYKYENETRMAVCKDFKPANCSHYLDVKNNTHWRMLPNKTIYSHVTKTWFQYGEYSIINGTLWLCLTKDFLAKINADNINVFAPTSIHHDILSYTTLASLSISVVSLTVLLTVYSIFPALRNLPGKNLMLLCGVLAIAHLLWLLQHKVYSWSRDMCFVMSMALPYFFLASFTCSNSIGVHSFLTFRALVKGKLRQRMSGKLFLWYCMYALGFPFLFVAMCWFLDHYRVVVIGYGGGYGNCWFGNSRGLYIAFVFPLFTLLLFNFILLLATLTVIYKCTKASRKLAKKNGGPNRKHIGIYLRMTTIMGFTWLFGVLQLLFPDSLAFQYLFVVLNGLQGSYLAGAFLFTDNIKKIVFRKSFKETRKNSTMNNAETEM